MGGGQALRSRLILMLARRVVIICKRPRAEASPGGRHLGSVECRPVVQESDPLPKFQLEEQPQDHSRGLDGNAVEESEWAAC